MKKIVPILVGSMVFLTSFIGCGLLDPTDSDSVTIKIDEEIGDISAGDSKYIEGSISGKPDPDPTSISITITDSDGNTVSTDKIKIEKLTPAEASKYDFKDDLELKIVSTASACDGDYTLTISATAGSETSEKEKTFTIVNGKDCNGTPITTVTLEAGANENPTLGSSIDLDAGEVYKMSQITSSIVSDIDLCYAYSGTNNVEKIGTALWAKNSGYDFAGSFGSSPPDIDFYQITMTETEFDNISTKEEIEDLWDDSETMESAYEADEGDVFIVNTTEDALALIRIDSQTDGTTGKITVKVAK